MFCPTRYTPANCSVVRYELVGHLRNKINYCPESGQLNLIGQIHFNQNVTIARPSYRMYTCLYFPCSSCGCNRCNCVSIIIIVVLLIVGVVLSFSLVIGLRSNATTYDTSSSRQYRPTTKVILAYKSDFCQTIVAQSTDTPKSTSSNATLYMLKSHPPSSDVENFNLSETATLKSQQGQGWNFYLNKGSHVSINICALANDGTNEVIDFYLIKGYSNYIKWYSNHLDSTSYVKTKVITGCTEIPYTAPSDDKYFFMFYTYFSVQKTHLSVDFNFERRFYHISPENIVNQCSFPLDGYSTCSVGVPFSSSYTALLSLNTSVPVNYDDVGTIKVSCVARNSIYAVIVVCIVVPVILLVVLVIVCMCIRARRSKSKYYKMIEENTTVARPKEVSGTADVAPGANHPPSYDRLYPSLHNNGYGAVSGSSENSNRR